LTVFGKIRKLFEVNWTTVLVGWNGLGILSPWPERWSEFPSLLNSSEISAYCDERLASIPDPAELNLIVMLLSSFQTESREAVKQLLMSLSELSKGNSSLELRKWRVALLEETLDKMSNDVLDGLMELTEFWQDFGFPADAPCAIQKICSAVDASEFYQHENLNALVSTHRTWIENEKITIKNTLSMEL
jgi:hypothetical protein